MALGWRPQWMSTENKPRQAWKKRPSWPPGRWVLLLVSQAAVAKGLFVFPGWRGKCHVSLAHLLC